MLDSRIAFARKKGTRRMSAPMPPAFLGQSSRMNALETNRYTEAWRSFGATVPCGLLVAAGACTRISPTLRPRSTPWLQVRTGRICDPLEDLF